MTLQKIEESNAIAMNTNDFTPNDYIEIVQEIQYHEYCISILDENDLTHAKEIVIRWERVEYLNDLLNVYRAQCRRRGFTLIQGGKA